MSKTEAKTALKLAKGKLDKFARYLLVVIAVEARGGVLKTTRSELAALTGLSPNTVTRALSRLQKLRILGRHTAHYGRGGGGETFLKLRFDEYEREVRRAAEEGRRKPAGEATARPKLRLKRKRRAKVEPGPLLPFDDLPETPRKSRVAYKA